MELMVQMVAQMIVLLSKMVGIATKQMENLADVHQFAEMENQQVLKLKLGDVMMAILFLAMVVQLFVL